MMRGRTQAPDPETMRENFEQSLTKIEVIWPEKKERLRFDNISTLPGIEAKVKLSDAADTLVYEIKVPLMQSEQHPFAISSEIGKKLGIGFEAGRPELKKMRGSLAGGRPPDGIGGGRIRGHRPQMPEPFKVWAIVRLVSD